MAVAACSWVGARASVKATICRASRVETSRKIEFFHQTGNPAHACAQQLDDAQQRVGALLEESQQPVSIDMDQSRRLVGHGRRAAAFAIQERHLAEELPRSMPVEDKLLALRRVDHDQDASREHAVETVRRVVTEEDNLAGGDHPAAGAPQQRPSLAVRQRAEDRVPSQEVVRCHRRYPRTGSAAGCVT